MKLAILLGRRLVGLATVLGLSGLLLITAPRDGVAEPKARFEPGAVEVNSTAVSDIEWADLRALGVSEKLPTLPNTGTELSVILWDERRGPVRTDTGGINSYSGNVQSVVNGQHLQ